MKAVTFQGTKDMQVKNVKDPEIQKKDDIIVKITATAICGTDLHIYQGALPTTKNTVIGHEPMGIVEEVGPDVTKVKKGDRIVLPFNISCGKCFYCSNEMESQCDNSNGNPHFDTGAYFGLTERYGDYSGGQAEYLRVPYGNFTPLLIPESSELEDESLLFLSDVLPTAWWSVEHAGVKKGDTVVVLGCGPIGLMTQKFAWMQGASRVIAVDEIPYRMELAKKINNVEIVDFSKHDNTGALIHEITQGGARVVIDCVGMDGKKSPAEAAQQKLMLQGGTLSAIDIAKDAVSKFGTIQLTGVYGLTYNQFPLGNMFERNVTLKMGQAPVIHLMPMLYQKIENGEFDPREIISHIMPLESASDAYQIFNDHQDNCTKVVLKP
ncbi:MULTISPECIES: zinc-dependent alcohol dehydrogenase [Planococcus]|uniref:Glutathione-dependent formaldehyde dehydrogenase n=1 Tax=Planococcus faecalis TaxID=1598147 RepID=A0ABM6IVK7_9BACL|nr:MULTISPECIES: zinc-dependent alcohol dehydrogenase [Planococcus]AQU80403.1 glutathione-dependent formaldehyde dehydrogenase [Planococcus faecalis]MDJ0330299.1 zinc-dependent alcohol dehydrogenase [Planococcus sp. S3-L1]OHX54826.1 glutathione-dependent formaldehyde dehydrogenase [Planococcus faecalis]